MQKCYNLKKTCYGFYMVINYPVVSWCQCCWAHGRRGSAGVRALQLKLQRTVAELEATRHFLQTSARPRGLYLVTTLHARQPAVQSSERAAVTSWGLLGEPTPHVGQTARRRRGRFRWASDRCEETHAWFRICDLANLREAQQDLTN